MIELDRVSQGLKRFKIMRDYVHLGGRNKGLGDLGNWVENAGFMCYAFGRES